MDALATGTRSNDTNNSSTRAPNARSMVATATSDENGGTRSCSKANSSAMSVGSKSRRVDKTWPNLTNMGPKDSSASRRRWPRGVDKLRPKLIKRRNKRKPGWRKPDNTNSSRPWRNTTHRIKIPRNMRVMESQPGCHCGHQGRPQGGPSIGARLAPLAGPRPSPHGHGRHPPSGRGLLPNPNAHGRSAN